MYKLNIKILCFSILQISTFIHIFLLQNSYPTTNISTTMMILPQRLIIKLKPPEKNLHHSTIKCADFSHCTRQWPYVNGMDIAEKQKLTTGAGERSQGRETETMDNQRVKVTKNGKMIQSGA